MGASGGVIACSLDCVWSLPIAGAQGTGAVCRASVLLPVPGPRGGRGHTCRTAPRACSASNATSRSAKCWAGTQAVYQVQQRLRYVRGWKVLPHCGPPCSDDPVSTAKIRGFGPWPGGSVSRHHRDNPPVASVVNEIEQAGGRSPRMNIPQLVLNPRSRLALHQDLTTHNTWSLNTRLEQWEKHCLKHPRNLS